MTREAWFAFRAYNSQTLYGYGTHSLARSYADALNETREINTYGVYEMTPDEIRHENLDSRNDTFEIEEELVAWREGATT